MELLATVMPDEALTLVQDNVYRVVTEQRGGLLSVGILAALWTSSSAIAAVTDALNRAYGVREKPAFLEGARHCYSVDYRFLAVSCYCSRFVDVRPSDR